MLPISLIGVQTYTLMVPALLLLMKFSAVVYSVSLCLTEICEYNLFFRVLEIHLFTHSLYRTRFAANEGLTKEAVRGYRPILRKEAILLSSGLLESPGALEKHLQRFAASEIMSILYDYPTLKNARDKALTAIHVFIDRMLTAAVFGTHLVKLFPWMMLIPERYVSIPLIRGAR